MRILNKHIKTIAVLLIINMLTSIIVPSVSYALTGGPSQPEVQSFTPVGTSDMVNLFTGDFSYNIPLFELPGPNGGYPFNLAYSAGVGMDQEASWVGLGWSLNPGAITRQMRGLPDDFNGDVVSTRMNIKTNETIGVGVGASTEIFGADGALVNVGVGVEASIFNNTYKGRGYTVSNNFNMSFSLAKGVDAGISAGGTFNSQEGISLSLTPSVTIEDKMKGTDMSSKTGLSLGMNYNSKSGLNQVALGMSYSESATKFGKGKKAVTFSSGGGQVFSASLSNAGAGYTPQISMPMKGESQSITLGYGFSVFGAFTKAFSKGFYNSQYLAQNSFEYNSYGYMYYDRAKNDKEAGLSGMMDFNRAKDGILRKETPNLGVPSLTYDIFSASGQGMSAMYRPYRSDVGVVFDPLTVSSSKGFGIGVEGANSHFGADASFSKTKTVSKKWELPNSDIFDFKTKSDISSKNYEPYYFKAYGEHSTNYGQEGAGLEAIGGDLPVRVKIDKDNFATKKINNVKRALLQKKDAYENAQAFVFAKPKSDVNRTRKNTVITPITNGQLFDNYGNTELPLFKINNTDFKRLKEDETIADVKDKIAGFIATNTEGLRYVYALPLYNTKQVDALFSTTAKSTEMVVTVDKADDIGDTPVPKHTAGIDNYLKHTTLPSYAHSFMLTSIVGPDYVDVTNDGVTKDDLGYWVKFNFQRRNEDEGNYKWRSPYYGANVNHGYVTDKTDDKASYSYGEKEVWYVKSVETKSHIAFFNLNKVDRLDGMGVSSEFQSDPINSDNVITKKRGGRLRYLENITLYTQVEYEASLTGLIDATPIKKIQFKYDNSLCKGVYNNEEIGGKSGKLTLTNLSFTYGKNNRGSLSPYTFTYEEKNKDSPNYNPDHNPDYSPVEYDRWGYYKPLKEPKKVIQNRDFPYVDQYVNGSLHDSRAAAWNLKAIELPSGATIKVDYEADTYGYVQHRTAMQMTRIIAPNFNKSGSIELHTLNVNPYTKEKGLNVDEDLKIYFKLEESIDAQNPDAQDEESRRKVVMLYIKDILDLQDRTGSPQLYYKVKVALNQDFKGWVAGYAQIDNNPATMGLASSTGGHDYGYGYFSLKSKRANHRAIHPFRYAALQHMQSNQPLLATSSVLPSMSSDGEKVEALNNLVNFKDEIKKITKGFYRYGLEEGWANDLVLSESVIRLTSPDKIKYGGGHRVKNIVLYDNWNPNNNTGDNDKSIYGQSYEYTTADENGKTISSGVAAYEPMIGGDEIPLRYAKTYSQAIPLKTSNSLYFEYPINESYYPGASVGYSKVTVKSLPSAMLDGTLKLPNDEQNTYFPSGMGFYATTGATVHEFYTAKEFPVITDETTIGKYLATKTSIIPFLGTKQKIKAAATQGYSIILNDMHGKPKKISNYAQDAEVLGSNVPINYTTPVSWVKYNYLTEDSDIDGTPIQKVLSEVPAITKERKTKNGTEDIKVRIGEQFEFFIDSRMQTTVAKDRGFNFNIDIITPLPIPIPSFWPNVGTTKTSVKTIVTNKIISRVGLLKSTEAFDGGSLVKTTNEVWNAETGDVAITSVTNNFDDKIYSYSIPAYSQYDQMGAAYKNIGLSFDANLVKSVQNPHYYEFTPSSNYSSILDETKEYHLVEGDELILTNDYTDLKAIAIYLGKGKINNGSKTGIFYVGKDEQSPGFISGLCSFSLYRSGRRNQLTAKVASINYLADDNGNFMPPETNDVNNFGDSNGNITVSVPNEEATCVAPPDCNNWNFNTCKCPPPSDDEPLYSALVTDCVSSTDFRVDISYNNALVNISSIYMTIEPSDCSTTPQSLKVRPYYYYPIDNGENSGRAHFIVGVNNNYSCLTIKVIAGSRTATMTKNYGLCNGSWSYQP